MVRIGDLILDCVASYSANDSIAFVEIVVPATHEITNDELLAIKDAQLLEELNVEYGEITGVKAVYALYGWQGFEKIWGGTRIRWQTYRTTDIEQIKQDNEDLTQALLELAQIVGGDNG